MTKTMGISEWTSYFRNEEGRNEVMVLAMTLLEEQWRTIRNNLVQAGNPDILEDDVHIKTEKEFKASLDEWTRIKYGPGVMGESIDYSQPWWQSSIFFKDLHNLIENEAISVLRHICFWLQEESIADPGGVSRMLDSEKGVQFILKRALHNADMWGLLRFTDEDLIFLVDPNTRKTRSGTEIRQDAMKKLMVRTKDMVSSEFIDR